MRPNKEEEDNGIPLSFSVIQQLKEASKQAEAASRLIQAIKDAIAVFAKKDKLSPEDSAKLRQKQAELMEKLSEFESITKRVQALMGISEESRRREAQSQPKSPQPEAEFNLPKVIICGVKSPDPVPQIIVCEPVRYENPPGYPLFQQFSGAASRIQSRAPTPTGTGHNTPQVFSYPTVMSEIRPSASRPFNYSRSNLPPGPQAPFLLPPPLQFQSPPCSCPPSTSSQIGPCCSRQSYCQSRGQ